MRALFVHNETESCCNKCLLASLVDTPLLAVVRSAIVRRVRSAKGDQTPKVSWDEITPCLLYLTATWCFRSFPCSSSYPRRRGNVRRLDSTMNRHIKVSWTAKLKVRMVQITWAGMRNMLLLKNTGWLRKSMRNNVNWRQILMEPWEHSRR